MRRITQQNRITIGRRTCCRFGTDVASSPRPVIDQRLLPPDFSEFLTDGARQDVHRPAGSERHNEAYRSARKIVDWRSHLSKRSSREGGQQRNDESNFCMHVAPPLHFGSAGMVAFNESRFEYLSCQAVSLGRPWRQTSPGNRKSR